MHESLDFCSSPYDSKWCFNPDFKSPGVNDFNESFETESYIDDNQDHHYDNFNVLPASQGQVDDSQLSEQLKFTKTQVLMTISNLILLNFLRRVFV